jgi:hypothetical protein
LEVASGNVETGVLLLLLLLLSSSSSSSSFLAPFYRVLYIYS